MLPCNKSGSAAVYTGPGVNEGESLTRWLERTAAIYEAVAGATKQRRDIPWCVEFRRELQWLCGVVVFNGVAHAPTAPY